MRQRGVLFVALIVGVILSAAPVMAHHSFAAEYDATKVVTMKGVVTKIEWTNPHSWFYMRVKNEDGSVATWGFELGAPHQLQSRGWTRTSMKLGDEVIVLGTLAKNGTPRVNARTVTLAATGQKLGAASSEGVTP
jgi:hypothetical protein